MGYWTQVPCDQNLGWLWLPKGSDTDHELYYIVAPGNAVMFMCCLFSDTWCANLEAKSISGSHVHVIENWPQYPQCGQDGGLSHSVCCPGTGSGCLVGCFGPTSSAPSKSLPASTTISELKTGTWVNNCRVKKHGFQIDLYVNRVSDITKHIVRTTTKLSVYKVVVYVHQTDSTCRLCETNARVQAPQRTAKNKFRRPCLVPMYKQAVTVCHATNMQLLVVLTYESHECRHKLCLITSLNTCEAAACWQKPELCTDSLRTVRGIYIKEWTSLPYNTASSRCYPPIPNSFGLAQPWRSQRGGSHQGVHLSEFFLLGVPCSSFYILKWVAYNSLPTDSTTS
jgi:hypothetical protein